MAHTPSQKAAVVYDRNLILFAGPGSGKTSTSIAKGRRILGIPDSRLCMVTFTTAAAAETQQRMTASFANERQQLPSDRLITGTFHSLALRHYQRHVKGHPKLLPPPARSAMLQSMLAKYLKDDRAAYALSLEQYQGALNPSRLRIPAEHMGFIEEYLQKMAATHATDLATIMRDCTMLMAAGEIPLLPITHLIGDEMQDADEVQLEFILNHTRSGVITTLVADDDQTIYEWRSALGYAGLQRFAAEANAKTITLGENFRSREEVVAHARVLIAHNDPDRIEKNQKAVRGDGGVLAAVRSADLTTECEAVAEAIRDYRYDDEEIAILSRNNAALFQMEVALAAEEIAYRRDGPTLWESREVGLMLSLMRALISSRTAELLPVLMLVELDPLVRKNLESKLGQSCGRFLDGEMPDLDGATAGERSQLARLIEASARWRSLLRGGDYNLAIPDIGYSVLSMYTNSSGYEGNGAQTKKISQHIESAIKVLTKLRGSLSKRLNTLFLMQGRNDKEHAVRLMTMHSSKGLEFDTVYLINASNQDDGATLMQDQPERRLFYVALTRARERFFVTFSGEPVKYIFEANLQEVPNLHDIFGAIRLES
ncbi:MAG: ATP-dependent helicase [Burkholderiaceae bacterium]|nr:ATP-dependent helicase [Burkholderiaceae bacterium]MDP3139462.1 ATP-dependent helicase [Burkholderiaceae bacterium]